MAKDSVKGDSVCEVAGELLAAAEDAIFWVGAMPGGHETKVHEIRGRLLTAVADFKRAAANHNHDTQKDG